MFIQTLGSFLETYNATNSLAGIKIQVTEVVWEARIKLVKCRINGHLPFDISLNTLGGVGSLAFLEAVDLKIGNDHLFKRSILLMKGWLKQEKDIKITGSSNGLLSSYALEVMILYIINRFHMEIKTPLECLVKFFEEFSEFDWHAYQVTISGRKKMASSRVESILNPVLDEEYLDECCRRYCVVQNSSDPFHQVDFNIIDPVYMCNNLGTSIKEKEKFIGGLKEGYKKIMKVVVSSNRLDGFTGFSAIGADESELLDLKGEDLGDLSLVVEEAREMQKHLTRAAKEARENLLKNRTTPAPSPEAHQWAPLQGAYQRPWQGAYQWTPGHGAFMENRPLPLPQLYPYRPPPPGNYQRPAPPRPAHQWTPLHGAFMDYRLLPGPPLYPYRPPPPINYQWQAPPLLPGPPLYPYRPPPA